MGDPGTADRRTLADRARAGDGPSLDRLLEQNLPALEAYVRLQMGKALREQEASSDLVQSVCREVLADLRFEVRDESAFRHWVFETAMRKILDRRRYWTAQKRDVGREESVQQGEGSEGRPMECHATLSTPSRQVELREEIQRLERAVERLPPDYRRVILLARIVELPQAEIAREMGRSEDSVRNLLARALARLSTLLSA